MVVLALWASYSYSNINPYYGYTPNAYTYGNPWSMDNVLPDPSGVNVNGVFYTYTPQKETDADFEVDIGNWNSDKSGYVWKENDNWDGSPGGIAIVKSIPLPYVHRSQFGDGFLETTGEGSVTDTNVIYSYKVDPCYNPQANIDCPGFIPPKVEIVDVSKIYDANDDYQIEEVEVDQYESKEDKVSDSEEEEEEDRKNRLERAMSISDNSALFAEGNAQSQMLLQMNASVNVTTYINRAIHGGTYKEPIELNGGNLPDNKSAKRMNWSTQKLHRELIDLQYNTQ